MNSKTDSSTLRKTNRTPKGWIVYPKFQLTILAVGLISNVITFCSVYFGINRSFHYFSLLGNQSKMPADHVYFHLLHREMHHILVNAGIGLTISILISVLLTTLLSQRLVGPIVRVQTYLSKVSKLKRVDEKLT